MFKKIFFFLTCSVFIFGQPRLTKFLHDTYEDAAQNSDSITIASIGRSGSDMLTAAILYTVQNTRKVYKTHLLPPKIPYSGKILFIFSNPSQSADSLLHRSIKQPNFRIGHFNNFEITDLSWRNSLGENIEFTLENNYLSFDGLEYHNQLINWLDESRNSKIEDANVMTVKYENLWDQETIDQIKIFLNLNQFKLPERKKRGCSESELTELEREIRKKYNLGTLENPRYPAYDKATEIWEEAKPYDFFKF
jgi:hypothetical protein